MRLKQFDHGVLRFARRTELKSGLLSALRFMRNNANEQLTCCRTAMRFVHEQILHTDFPNPKASNYE
jgi:hypothetical protein